MTTGRRAFWLAFVLAGVCFGLVYSQAFAFVPVEGDETITFAYHALGRNEQIQPPYAPYQILMDRLLARLPADLDLLIQVSMIASAIGGFLMFVWMFLLVSEWAKAMGVSIPAWMALVWLAAIPEFFYLGLVYSPTVIGMAFLLAAHWIVRRGVQRFDADANRPASYARLGLAALCAALCAALGAALRWDLIVYLGVILVDVVLMNGEGYRRFHAPRGRLLAAALWGAVAALAWLGLIYSLGGLHLFFLRKDTVDLATQPFAVPLLEFGAMMNAFLSPAVVWFGLVGGWELARRRRPLAAVVVVGLALILPWAARGTAKYWLPAWPGIALCVGLGFLKVWSLRPGGWAWRGLAVGALLLPWLVGVRAVHGDTCWGPGFECQPYNRAASGSRVSIAFGAGSAVPTAEGPRSIYGHAWALLGGERRRFVVQWYENYRRTYEAVRASGLPWVEENEIGWALVTLIDQGLTTQTAPIYVQDLAALRPFQSASGEQVLLYQVPNAVWQDPQRIAALAQALPGPRVVLHGAPSFMRAQYRRSSQGWTYAGEQTAIVDLARFAESLAGAP